MNDDNNDIDHFNNLQFLETLEDKLNYISSHIGLKNVDLDSIFASYLNLRQENRELRKVESEHWNEARKGAIEHFKLAQDHYFISLEELSKMTIPEICERIDNRF